MSDDPCPGKMPRESDARFGGETDRTSQESEERDAQGRAEDLAMTHILFFLAFGFLVSVILTPWMIRLAHAGVGLDAPDEGRKRQASPIPRIGGVPLMFSLVLGVMVILWMQPGRSFEWFPIMLGLSMMFALGLWDDVKPLGAKKKLLGQIVIASIVASLGLEI